MDLTFAIAVPAEFQNGIYGTDTGHHSQLLLGYVGYLSEDFRFENVALNTQSFLKGIPTTIFNHACICGTYRINWPLL